MNNEKMKALLADKVDSLERWQAICAEAGSRWDRPEFDLYEGRFMHYGGAEYIGTIRHFKPEQRWWMIRETYRDHLAVYPAATTVLEQCIESFGLQQYFIHISKEDPTMVAYTASIEDGQRDKQVRLSFGKLLRKLLLLVTDTHIQMLEASHRSEMDPTFLVARTPEEIKRVYTEMLGDSGCMRYPSRNFNLKDAFHPSQVYAYNGLGVAYTEVEGVIKSRAVIYDNPDDAADKRYVRIYGDPCLQRKLERAGYRCDNLQGAKLRAIKMQDAALKGNSYAQPNYYSVAYLDGSGGNQNQRQGCYGYILQGEDCIRLIDDTQANRLERMGYSVSRLKSTETVHYISEVDPAKLMFECWLQKKPCNSLDTAQAYILVDGVERTISQEALDKRLYVTEAAGRSFNSAGQMRVVYMSAAEQEAHCFFERHNWGEWFLDTPENRKHCGMVLLSEAHGYPPKTWAAEKDCVQATPGTDTWVKTADTMIVFDEAGNETRVIKDQFVELRKDANYTLVTPKGSTKALSHVKNPRLVVTLGRKKCITGWHEITQLFDETWEYNINLGSVRVFGEVIYFSAKHTSADAVRGSEAWTAKLLAKYIVHASAYRTAPEKIRQLTYHVTNLMRSGYRARCYYTTGSGALMRGSPDSTCTLDQMRAAAEKIAGMSDQEITDTLDASYLVFARGFQHHATLLLAAFDAKVAEWAPAEAAAHAAEVAAIDELIQATAVHITRERAYA